MKRTNQGGSILSFIVIGGVLALLLVGGIYMVRHAQPAPDAGTTAPAQPVATPSTDQATDGASDKTTNTPAATGNGATNNGSAPAPDSVTTTPATGTTPAITDNDSSAGSTSSDTTALPQTGSVQTAGTVIALIMLVGASAAYVQSRRQLTDL